MKTRWIEIKAVLASIVQIKLLAVRAVLVMSCTLLLAACSERELILEGERVAVLENVDPVTVDAAALAEGAGLSPILKNINAGHPGLSAGHAGGNPLLDLPLEKVGSRALVELARMPSNCLHLLLVRAAFMLLTPQGWCRHLMQRLVNQHGGAKSK